MMADRRAMIARVGMATAGAAAVVGVMLAVRTVASGGPRPALVEHAAPKRPSLHAAPAGDVAALNADVQKRLPGPLVDELLPGGRPGMVIFLKADCDCSKGFAVMASALAPQLREAATCTAVIEGTAAEAESFATTTGLAFPFIAQPGSDLAQAWGVRKAGCFALVASDGSVEAVWPGVSRPGFRDLAGRLGLPPPPDELLVGIPGAATVGCPLECADQGTASAGLAAPSSKETNR
jgi:hypothetical protein